MSQPLPPTAGTAVRPEEDLRRAIRPEYVKAEEISEGAFRTRDMSMDAASLASLQESRERKQAWGLAVVRCDEFHARHYTPEHDPLVNDPDLGTNLSHCLLRQRMTPAAARAIALVAFKRYLPPLLPG